MKAISPNIINSRRNPWGTEPERSHAHAKWLSDKLIGNANRKIEKASTYRRDALPLKLTIQLESDLCDWYEPVSLIVEAFETAGWKNVHWIHGECGGILLVEG
jgi:hypothetical protein